MVVALKKARTNRERLTRLRKALSVISEPLPEGQVFDMRHWGEKRACGTYACLAGTLALHPWFRARGYTAAWLHHNLCPPPGVGGFPGMTQDFFGLTEAEAEGLTDPYGDGLDTEKTIKERTFSTQCAVKLSHVKRRLTLLIKRYTPRGGD